MTNNSIVSNEAEEIMRLKQEVSRLQEENSQKDVYKTKFISFIGKLSSLQSSTELNNDQIKVVDNNISAEHTDTASSTPSNDENLLANADDIITNVVNSFQNLSFESQQQVKSITEDGSSFLQRVEVLEQRCAHAESNAKYALSKALEIEQYLKIDQLLVHGLNPKDFPRDEKGYIKKGRAFSSYMAEIIKTRVLPDHAITKEQILSCISVSHPIKSRKNANNLISLVKFSNRDMRNTIFFAKKALKGSNIAITEHLTPLSLDILNAAKKEFGRNNVWSSQTKIKAKVCGRSYILRSLEDVFGLKQWEVNNK